MDLEFTIKEIERLTAKVQALKKSPEYAEYKRITHNEKCKKRHREKYIPKPKKEPIFIPKDQIEIKYPELAGVDYRDIYGGYRVYKNGAVISKYGIRLKLR